MLDYDTISNFQLPTYRRSYSIQDSLLYALGVIPDGDPFDPRDLNFLLETHGLRVLPTFATILAKTLTPHLGLDMPKVVHAEQNLTCHRPLPPSGDLLIDARVTSIIDKGAEKGALVTFESAARIADTDEPVFLSTNTLYARGDGGCGGPDRGGPQRHILPERPADLVHETRGRVDQALLYRLNGDFNPLHADPDTARRVGFPRPILHGLCTYGMACRAIAKTALDGEVDRISTFGTRFTAPLFPGETLITDIWRDDRVISFRCRAAERDMVVLDNGRSEIR